MTHRLLRLAAAAGALCLSLPGAVFAQAPADGLPDGPGKEIVQRVCTTCHDTSPITGERRTPDGWGQIVGQMVATGAVLTPPEREAVVTYLSKALNSAPASPDAPATPVPTTPGPTIR